MKRYKIEDVCHIFGVEEIVIVKFIENEWIDPLSLEDKEFDEEDLSRIRLIFDLMNNLEVNEQSVPIILHLLDQIHRLHFEIRNRVDGG